MIILDLDGVLLDFVSALADVLDIHDEDFLYPDRWDYFEDWGYTSDDVWDRVNKVYGFWENLMPYPWTTELVKLCEHYSRRLEMEYSPGYGVYRGFKPSIGVATDPHYSKSADGKILSIRRLFGKDFNNFFITRRKSLLAQPGRILIDDNEKACSAFRDEGGSAILFPASHNRLRDLISKEHHKNTKPILAYVEEQIRTIKGIK